MSKFEYVKKVIRQIWASVSQMTPFPWSTLKGIANSKFARLTVIVPIVGWILVYNDTLIALLEKYLEEDFPEEINWRVYTFYVGLFFVSVSSILYATFCPRGINEHPTMVDFIRHYRMIFTEDYAKYLDEKRSREPSIWETPPEARRSISGGTVLVHWQSENEEKIVNYLRDEYFVENYSWPIVRVVALVVFLIGAGLASIPTLTTVHWASCSVVENASDNLWLQKFQNTCPTYADGSEDVLEDVE